MGFCTKCGAEITSDLKFCESCGAPIKIDEKTKISKKSKGEKKVSYNIQANTYLWIGLLFLYVIPMLVESLLMLRTKQALSSFLVLAIDLLSLLIAFYLLSKFLSLKTDQKSSENIKTSASGLLIMVAYFIGALRLTEILADLALRYFMDMSWLTYVLYVAIVILSILSISTQLFRTLERLNHKKQRSLFKYPKLFWKTILFIGFAFFVLPDLLIILFSGEIINIPLSFTSTMTEQLVLVTLQGYFSLSVIQSMQNKLESIDQQEITGGPGNFKWLAMVVVLGFFAFDTFSMITYSTVDAIEASIQDDMNQGAFYMAAGDLEMAMHMYDSAYSKTKAWLSFVRDTPESVNDLKALYSAHPDDDEIKYLLALKTYSVNDFEMAIFESEDTSRWYHALLKAYQYQENNPENPQILTEKQALIQKEILNACIAGQVLINSSITLEDVKGKEDDIVKRIEPYLGFIEVYDAYKIANQISLNGGMNNNIINQLLTYAEDHPDNLLGQYLAFQGGREFLFDGASHYQRTAEAAIRFRDLYVDQLTDDVTTKTIAIDMEISDALMGLHDYEKAIVYLEEAHELGAKGDTMLLAAYCYEAMENYDKALEMAEVFISENPSNPNALNIAMISALKIGDVTASLEHVSDLLAILDTLEDEAYLLADANLYIYVQYLTVWDQTQWTPQMKYKVYPDLTEEQYKILEEDPLLNHYIQALYYTFSDKKYDIAWDHTMALLEVMPKSAQIQYLAGTVQFNQRVFDQAITYYQASLDLDDSAPTLWFALANAYDALEDYKQAYNCTLKVNELLQYSNHAVDIYGVQYHNNVLMNSLANKLNEGGN